MASTGDDLFSVFDTPSTSSVISPVGQKDASANNVSEKLGAKERAEELLKSLASGIPVKRTSDLLENGSTVDGHEAKKQHIEDEMGALEAMPRINIHTLQTAEACVHEVAVPHDQEYRPLQPRTGLPAKEYPFRLDPFQNEAIACIDNYQSVLVSAHTSAGKTVVAEYAIALSLRDKQRVIYTSPIKALSNQKYREMFELFGDAGLMTGDVTINPSASCLVMTTEILRSMLYRGSEIMREVGWVVFDEIHYMRDKERGVVWEETIILLPDNVRYVFLSATIPNARQFAEWVCYLHHQPCHVVYTDTRPVPLQHYVFPAGGEGIHLVLNEQNQFRDENFNTAMASLKDGGAETGKSDKKFRARGGTSVESSCKRLVKLLAERKLTPVIVFSFSRKDCEAYALQVATLDFNSEDEKQLVNEVFNNAMDVLSEDDRKLPQVEHVLPLLRRGVGIHHSGLLPILKETIEILFGEGLIKVLFATETFSMGLNMPARTVMFTSARKFDGKDYRWISSGEYIQMSGRAGRRGKDALGMVILMLDQQITAEAAKNIIKGQPDYLNSQFHLTYNMVLNLLRVEGINPEFMLERSFYQFQNFGALPGLYSKVKTCGDRYMNMKVPRELEIAGYHKLKEQIVAAGREIQKIITKPIHIVPFLQPGRMVHIRNPTYDFGWGLVINFHKKVNKDDPAITDPIYVVDVLMQLSQDSADTKNTSQIKPVKPGEKGRMEVVPVVLNLICEISSVRLYYPEDLRSLENRNSVLKTIQEVCIRFPDGIPLLDPIDDMQIKDKSMKDLVKKIESLQERQLNHPLRNDPKLEELSKAYEDKLQAEEEWKVAKLELKKARSLLQLDELKCRKRVLRRLNYCDQQDVITLKGRVACEISAADELLLTEMVFNGLFNDLSVQQCVALLSCFVFEEKAEMPKLAEEMSGILRQMQDMARQIARVKNEAKLPVDEDEYVDQFRPHLMGVVHAWCGGCSFAELCAMTEVFEGSIIRCMRRLEELLREMCGAAKTIGNADLEQKFAEGIVRIKRDIVFAASLYL